ncbi:MAG: prolipoprotein diacylglyceryl transferase [Chloroflexi bacterium HGW-Chloroflexi-2]|jgi:phosphatidylglycerol:prolipoprotein diacylglycerol transferase|nr:MAG: prolipoprotein diacylglyceryl transferase [Chloroflexi bacterium HGW-Chloroflexi-2]
MEGNMITISVDPIIFSIGHFHLRWYGLIISIAMLMGVWLAIRESGRKGFNTDVIFNSAAWIIIAGFIGARLFHVIDHWSDVFAANPIRSLYFWEGGLAIWGGVLGGLIAAAILAKIEHWKLSRFLDALVPGVVLAQAIGRFACIITGDSIGKETSGPFGFAYTSPNAMVPELGVYYTPTPVFEILMNLTIFSLLWSLRKKGLQDGVLTLIYLVSYSFIRFFIAFTSSYQIVALGLNQAQIISILVFAGCIPFFVITILKKQSSSI